MFRSIVLFACPTALVLGLILPMRLSAAAREKKQQPLAERAKRFEYPGGKQLGEYGIETAYQYVATTPDDLDTVDKWYRRVLSIQPAEGTGVSSATRMIDVDSPKERGFDVRRSLYINEQKLKDDDPKQKVPQVATVRCYVVKEEAYTLVVVAARSKDDKATQISVSLIPETSK